MSIPERLANMSWQTVLIIMAVLIVLRFVLVRLKSPTAKSAAELAESLAIAVGLVFLIIRPFFVQSFFIPSESMLPTLLVEDHIVANRTVYHLRDPRRGEIVVFAAPPEAREEVGEFGTVRTAPVDFIKRTIAVEGDELYVVGGYVQVGRTRFRHRDLAFALRDGEAYAERVLIKDDGVYLDGRRLTVDDIRERIGTPDSEITLHPGYVVLNGKKLDEPYVMEDPDDDYPVLTEPMPGDIPAEQSYNNLRKAEAAGKLTIIRDKGRPRVRIGKGYIFMMGDNRNDSKDSRVWGPLDADDAHGRAMFIFWPLGRIQWVR